MQVKAIGKANNLQSVHMPNTFSVYLWILVRKILVNGSRFATTPKFSYVHYMFNRYLNWIHWLNDDIFHVVTYDVALSSFLPQHLAVLYYKIKQFLQKQKYYL